MPIIAMVSGVRIIMFFNDHDPPHFHFEFAEHRGRISIATLSLLSGTLPASKRRHVLEWARLHQDELSAIWQDIRNDRKPRRIE